MYIFLKANCYLKNYVLEINFKIYLSFIGEDDDGDIYTPRNLRSFQKFVRANTDGLGVHFMMADGVIMLLSCTLFLSNKYFFFSQSKTVKSKIAKVDFIPKLNEGYFLVSNHWN